MRMVDLIAKKKHSEELSRQEIQYIVNGYTEGSIPDYQMSAFLMATWFNGMTTAETVALTEAMVKSGDIVDLSFVDGKIVDKHSTGGVGDKVSLIVAPIVAALGVPVAKMSGRGLGHTGGTIDKLEAVEGFKTDISIEEFKENVIRHQIAIVGQTGNLVPADKKIYALRDVTETVDSIPLIASSIMSKKIAAGADAIVLDVKVGSGAFMKTVEEAEKLAQTMVRIGKSLNRKTVAILSNMDQPLGHEIGNMNEVAESLKLLKGEEFSDDLMEIITEISSQMVYLAERAATVEEARKMVSDVLENGKAYAKFLEFIELQGGRKESIQVPETAVRLQVKSSESGYVSAIESHAVGVAAMLLGAGRATKEDAIDHQVGVTIKAKIGEKVEVGDVLFEIASNKQDNKEAAEMLRSAVTISPEEIKAPSTIIKIIS